MKYSTSPLDRWGPARARDRTGRYALPKADVEKSADEFPSYYHVIRNLPTLHDGSMEDRSSTEGPPSYGNGNGSGSGSERKGQVKSVSASIEMTTSVDMHDVNERSRTYGGVQNYTYDVTQPEAAEYASVRKSGLVNKAFVDDEDTNRKSAKASVTSRASSVEGPPIENPYDEAGTAL